ncbi:MAG: hypothetical protein ACOCZU_07950, partial [Planctomycetota bacterium]
MIVPRNSLIWLVAATLLPTTVAAAVVGGLWPVVQLLAAVLACAAVLDAAVSIRRLDGATAADAEVVRLTRDVDGVI